MKTLLAQVRKCTVCAAALSHPPRPILSVGARSSILIIGQSPGLKVHNSGIPWQDASGKTLREWLGVDEATFYNVDHFALMPMGFCYPGKGVSGDLPPRPECAPLWHERLLAEMKTVSLTLLIGQYSQRRYLAERAGENLTDTVRRFSIYLPRFLPLPHPSPRNRPWLAQNSWFGTDLLPILRQRVAASLGSK